MAEYIDREELSVTPIDITDLPRDKCLMVYLAEDVDSLPTADVVERSKIDKAIEEIEDLDNAKYGFESYEQCKAEVLEILKRNIGE